MIKGSNIHDKLHAHATCLVNIKFISKTPDNNPTKRPSSQLSPNENDPGAKKANVAP